jgi:hypothetical protein
MRGERVTRRAAREQAGTQRVIRRPGGGILKNSGGKLCFLCGFAQAPLETLKEDKSNT